MKKNKPNKASARPEMKSVDRQVHQYDKILRENLEAALPGLVKRLLDIHAVHSEELPGIARLVNVSDAFVRKVKKSLHI